MRHLRILEGHPYARCVPAMRALQSALGLGAAKRAIDRAWAGELVDIALPEDAGPAIARCLAELGWVVSWGDARLDLGPPEPPEWAQRRRGAFELTGSVGVEGGVLRLVGVGDVEVGDTLAVILHENVVLGGVVAEVTPAEAGLAVVVVVEDDEGQEGPELLACLFRQVEVLEVLGAG